MRGFFAVIEETLLSYLWLKQENFLKSDYEVYGENVDSCAMHWIKQYLELFKGKIINGGNNLKILKFHQMLLHVTYVVRKGGITIQIGNTEE